MRARTLANLISDVQKRADVENATAFMPTADITEYLNQGWARIYGLLCRTGENYYLSQATFSTVANQPTYYTTAASGVPAGSNVLPLDLWDIKGVDVQIQSTGIYSSAKRFQFEQRNDFQQFGWSWPTVPLYDYQGSGNVASLTFIPTPPGGYTTRLWYYPAAVRMANNSDTIDGGNGWEIYAIDWAARRVAEKDENYELCARLDQSMGEMEMAIKAEAATRNVGQAPRVRRTRYKRTCGFWGPGSGGGGSYGG